MLHQKGTSLTEIPSDVELCYAVSNELGQRHRLGVAPDEVCSYLLCQYNHFSRFGFVKYSPCRFARNHSMGCFAVVYAPPHLFLGNDSRALSDH